MTLFKAPFKSILFYSFALILMDWRWGQASPSITNSRLSGSKNQRQKIIHNKNIKKNKASSKVISKPSKKLESSLIEEVRPYEPTAPVALLYPEDLAVQVSSAVNTLANRLDSFFGQERSDDENTGSTLRLIPSYTLYNNQPNRTALGINLNLKLQNLEKKTKEIEKKVTENVLATTNLDSLVSKDKAAKKKAVNEQQWRTNFESVIELRPSLFYSGKFRTRKNFFYGGSYIHRFAASIGWDSDNQFTQKNEFSTDLLLREELLFRFSNTTLWYITRENLETTHGPSLIQTLNKYNSVSYSYRLDFANTGKRMYHSNTTYTIDFRNSSPSKRIFIDFIPSLSYPRSHSYKEVRAFEIRLEYFFGDVAS